MGDWRLPLWLWLGACIGGPLAIAGAIALVDKMKGGEAIIWAMVVIWKLALIATSVFVGIRRTKSTGNVGGGIGFGFGAYAVGMIISLSVAFVGCLGLMAGTSFH